LTANRQLKKEMITMTQRQLDRAVARATGESLATIARMGFGIANPFVGPDECQPAPFGPNLVDWDAQDGQRQGHRFTA
jgi:hypothetical protein